MEQATQQRSEWPVIGFGRIEASYIKICSVEKKKGKVSTTLPFFRIKKEIKGFENRFYRFIYFLKRAS